MELNRAYEVNIVCQTARGRSSFIAVEQFDYRSSQYFQNYYKQVVRFNQCSEWFEKLDYPNIEIGKIVLAQTNKKKNIWSRGIISQYSNNNLPKLYFIDTQRFSDLESYFELRTCPHKLSQLPLPTYSIYVDFCLDDNNQLQSAIEMLIEKNQYGDLNFNFTPQSVTNNVYVGELTINHKINNSVITFEKFVKNFWKNTTFNDLNVNRLNGCPVFNPLQFNYLHNIFLPKDPNNKIFSDKNQGSSYPEVCHSKNVFKFDEFSSFLGYIEYYKCCVDDSPLSDEKIRDNCVSMKEQKMYTSESAKNQSICSLKETHDTTSVDSSLIENVDKSHETSSSNYDGRSKPPNSAISTNTTIVDEINGVFISPVESICTNNIMSEIESSGSYDKEIKVDVSNIEFNVKTLITNHIRCLRKLKDSGCQQNNSTKTTNKKIPSKTLVTYSDTELWWTDSDDTDSEN